MDRLHSAAAGALHEKFVFGRRIEVLSDWFSQIAPQGSRILDVGCGDGQLAALLQAKRPDVLVQGIDVLVRKQISIPVQPFDGVRIPFEDDSFDVVEFCDVLHHTEDATVLLREARRVARYVLIKDHYKDGFLAGSRLRLMDWVGNARFGVALPYNYWTGHQWNMAWEQIGLRVDHMVADVGLYPPPLHWVFGAKLHFIALLERVAPSN